MQMIGMNHEIVICATEEHELKEFDIVLVWIMDAKIVYIAPHVWVVSGVMIVQIVKMYTTACIV